MKSSIAAILIVLTCLTAGMLVFLFSTGSNADGADTFYSDEIVRNKEYKDSVSFSPSTIITNIKNSNRYLRIAVTMEIKDEKSKEFFTKNEYKIKDIIIGVLRDKTELELVAPDSQEQLKSCIRDALCTKINIGGLIDIFIDEFVIQ